MQESIDPTSAEDEKIDSKELIENLKFCVFDLETTGGNQRTDKIIEIGMVKVHGLKIIEEKTFLIRPEVKIPEFIQKLTTIRQEDVASAPVIEEVIDEILEFMHGHILVAHNTSFDIPFFNSVLDRLGRPKLENPGLCTNLMTKYMIPNLLNSNLSYMCRIFGINHGKVHRALDDASATAKLLICYLSIYIEKGIKKINHLYYPRNKYELDRMHVKKNECSIEQVLEKLKKIHSPYLFTLKGENGVILYSLPCGVMAKQKQIENIKAQLKARPWEIITIRLFGPYIEALMHFSTLYPKMDPQTRGDIISFLRETQIEKKDTSRPWQKLDTHEIHTWVENNLGDFVIANHLVPDQMFIIPLQALNQKNQLIFRYPGHQKKLIQYINAKASRLSANKMKRSQFQAPLRDFILEYLLQHNSGVKTDFLLFRKSLPLKRSADFFELMNDFLAKHHNGYKYPKEYI